MMKLTPLVALLIITSITRIARSPLEANAEPAGAPQANAEPARAPQTGSPNYIGNVTVVERNVVTRNARLHFESGARTKWHSHENGQILLCQEGVARTQVKGGPVIDLHVGETTYVPSRVPHWHGASPGHSATILSMDIGNGKDIWMDPVTDAEYNAKPGK